MTISKGFESKEVQEYKRYIGVCPVYVVAVNPTKEQHEKLFNTTLNEEPVYVSKVSDADGNEIDNARINIILKPDTEKVGFDMPLISMNLFLQKKHRIGATSGKCQVVDKYGRTAWATPEDIKAKNIPVYSNGPAAIDKEYRPLYIGEADLIEFVKAYLCIPSVDTWDNNLKKMVPNMNIKPEECECIFDNIEKVFKGDFSEIIEALGLMPNNKVKVLLGVRTDADSGKMYQVVYTKKFARNDTNNYNSLNKEVHSMIDNAAMNGRVLTTEYQVVPVHEYVVVPTEITPTENNNDLPFDNAGSSTCPWD